MTKRHVRYKVPKDIWYTKEDLDFIRPEYMPDYYSDKRDGNLSLPNKPLTIKLDGVQVSRFTNNFYASTTLEGKTIKLEIKGSVVYEAIEHAGIQKGGTLPGKYIWIQISGNLILVRVGSENYKEAVLNAHVNSSPKLKAKDLIPGNIYMNGLNRMHLYVGRYYVLHLQSYETPPSVWLDTTWVSHFSYELHADESREQLLERVNRQTLTIRYTIPTLRKFVRESGLTASELNNIVMSCCGADTVRQLLTNSYNHNYLQYINTSTNKQNLTINKFTHNLLMSRLEDPVMRLLSLEELPKYLTHSVETVRQAAKKRVKQLTKGGVI